MARSHAHQIDPNCISQNHREGEQNPRQIRRLKIEQSKEVHSQKRIPSAPNVHQHDCKGLPEEQQVDKEGKEDHEDPAEEEHHNEVSSFASKAALFEHPAVAICENHVEQKTEADCAEEEERRDEPPHLAL